MNDVTALMGKLKANVAYLQFNETTEERPAAQPAAASLLTRYAPAAIAPATAADDSRLLAAIFKRLAR